MAARLLQVEMFASAPCTPERLWALVGDLRRLPEWTDAEEVRGAPEPPLAVGARFQIADRDRLLGWVVITTGERLIEAKTDDSACGRVGVGLRVGEDPVGSRLILAGMLDPSGGALRARLRNLPGLRNRLERWADLAVRRAGP